MPDAYYPLVLAACPWPGCEFRIEMVDFRLELAPDKSLYARVMLAWASQPNYGLVARCPGCRQYVWFDPNGKRAISDLPSSGFDLLPDDWHLTADIM